MSDVVVKLSAALKIIESSRQILSSESTATLEGLTIFEPVEVVEIEPPSLEPAEVVESVSEVEEKISPPLTIPEALARQQGNFP